MEGKREDSLPPRETPNSDYKVRALDDQGRSCVIPYSSLAVSPQEDDVKDFWDNGKIIKKRYVSGAWVEVGLEWDL